MDIHRCRFMPYEAAGINVVAFSHPRLSPSDKHSKTTPVRLAIGRTNGDIEIWNPWQGTWMQELTIAGGKNRSVEGLAWVVEEDEELPNGAVVHGRMRLFSIGYTNTVTEWDLERGGARRHASGQHSEIWCMAVQPRASEAGKGGKTSKTGKTGKTGKTSDASSSQRIVGGTVDGSLVLYSTEDDDLRFQRLCKNHRSGVRVVSLAFQSRHVVVAGCSDATLRVFDLRKGAVLHALTLGRDTHVRTKTPSPYFGANAKELIVWSVCCLANGDIVSGDSTGQICIWDGRTYTQAQRIQAHRQDILSLTTSADGSVIVSGGMDRRVVLYRQTGGHEQRWSRVWHRRYPQHDVKTLAAFEGQGMSVVVAGGPDATPFVLPLQKSGFECHRPLSHLPQSVPLVSAPAARLAVCWWGRNVYIWSFDASVDAWMAKQQASGPGPLQEDVDVDADNVNPDRRLIGRIALNGDAFVTSAAVSADGSLLVVATATAVRAFELRRVNGTPADSQCRLVISRVLVPAAVAGGSGFGGEAQGAKETQGATRVAVSPDGRWVSVVRGIDNFVTMLETCVQSVPDREGVLHDRIVFRRRAGRQYRRLRRVDRSAVLPNFQAVSGLGNYDRRIAHMVFSPDSRMLATADLAGFLDTWILSDADGRNGESAGSHTDRTEPDADRSDSESEQEDGAIGSSSSDGDALGQWIRNPRAEQLPRLPGAPIVLSFAPDVPGQPAVAGVRVGGHGAQTSQDTDTANGVGRAVADDYVLLAIVSPSRFFALHPLRGRFVSWYRRLVPASLPMDFINIMDLAKGVVWQGPRIWVYSSSYIFMLDTSMDRSRDGDEVDGHSSRHGQRASTKTKQQPPQPPMKKRKREANSGAGGLMTMFNLQPQRVKMVLSSHGKKGDGETGGASWVDVGKTDGPREKDLDADEEEEEEDDDDDVDLASDDSVSLDGQAEEDEGDDYENGQTAQKRRPIKQLQKSSRGQQSRDRGQHPGPTEKSTRWWLTFKYRAVLGMVPLSSTASANQETAAYPPLEVAIVERPVFEADLPVRYMADTT